MGEAHNLQLSYNLNQGRVFSQNKKAATAQLLGQSPPSSAVKIKEYAPSMVPFDEGFIILILVISMRMALARQFMANLGLSLHRKMQGGGQIHQQLVLWTEIQQKIVMKMQSGVKPSEVTLHTLIAMYSVNRSEVQDWVRRLAAAGVNISANSLEYLRLSDISDKKDAAEQESSSSQALTDNRRAQLQAAETDYSTLATLYSSLQSSFKNILSLILRAQ